MFCLITSWLSKLNMSYRYATKYASKSARQTELLDEVIRYLGERVNDPVRPNIQQTLTHLVLANCSQRAYISKQELAYKTMNLPFVFQSFKQVRVVGCYQRALILELSESETKRFAIPIEPSTALIRKHSTMTMARTFSNRNWRPCPSRSSPRP